jgi:hypothetical protein
MLAAICLTRRSDFIHEGEGKNVPGVFSAWMIRLEPHRVSGCDRAKRMQVVITPPARRLDNDRVRHRWSGA